MHHAIPLTAQEVVRMHAKDDVPAAVGAVDLQPDRHPRAGEHPSSPAAASSSPPQHRATRSAATIASTQQSSSPLCLPDSGESVQVRSKESVKKDVLYLSSQEHKRFRHGREVSPEAQLLYEVSKTTPHRTGAGTSTISFHLAQKCQERP